MSGAYTKIADKTRSSTPRFKPASSISDWELAPRNAIKEIHPTAQIHGIGSILLKEYGLKPPNLVYLRISSKPGNNIFYQTVDGDPFLPATLILPIYSSPQTPDLPNLEMDK